MRRSQAYLTHRGFTPEVDQFEGNAMGDIAEKVYTEKENDVNSFVNKDIGNNDSNSVNNNVEPTDLDRSKLLRSGWGISISNDVQSDSVVILEEFYAEELGQPVDELERADALTQETDALRRLNKHRDVVLSLVTWIFVAAMVAASGITIGETSLARLLWSTKKVDDDKTIDDHGVDQLIRLIFEAIKSGTKAIMPSKHAHLVLFYALIKLIQEEVLLEVKEAIGANYTYSIDEFSHKIMETTLYKRHYHHATLTETLSLSSHPSDTKVFTMKMEILLEPTLNKLLVVGFNPLVHSFCALSTLRRSGLRTASAAAKPCQGDSLEFYLITGRIPTVAAAGQRHVNSQPHAHTSYS
ncbi:hypothetical protein Tco_1247326 [Tanacetum coccineum]